MAHLSSCYFCGAALDEPLTTYSVGAETTVTLCPTCHRKLETVFEAAGESIGTAESPDSADISAGTGDGSDSPEPADSRPGDAAAGDGDDALVWGTDETGQPDSQTQEADTRDADDTAENAGSGTQSRASDETVGGGPDEADVADETDGTGVASDDDADGTNGATGAGSEDSIAGAGHAGNSAGTPDISTAEYNKVIRLLQNREFPVERAEIVTVATNAYGLTERDCGAVIDRAIDRGILEETDGELRRPE